jgi:hypothetical protein
MRIVGGYSRERVSGVVILVGGVGTAVLFLGSCWFRHGEKWNRVLLRSDDGGKSWTSRGLGSIPKADLRGAHLDLGVNVISRGIFSCPEKKMRRLRWAGAG